MSPRGRIAMWSCITSVLVTAAVAVVGAAIAFPASAVQDPLRCGPQALTGSSAKKCPSPVPTPSPTSVGSEFGCRNLISGAGQFRGVGPVPEAGAALEFVTTYDAPTCSEVTYTVIARDMDTFAELDRHVQQGNAATEMLASVIALTGYAKECIAIDVIVSEGAVVHDIAPNSRDLTQVPFADLCRQGVSEMVWN